MILQQGIHGVLRQSLLRLPDGGEVLRRIGLCVDGSDQETGQQTRGKNNCGPASRVAGALAYASDSAASCFAAGTMLDIGSAGPRFCFRVLLILSSAVREFGSS